jgi:hypothetical protein
LKTMNGFQLSAHLLWKTNQHLRFIRMQVVMQRKRRCIGIVTIKPNKERQIFVFNFRRVNCAEYSECMQTSGMLLTPLSCCPVTDIRFTCPSSNKMGIPCILCSMTQQIREVRLLVYAMPAEVKGMCLPVLDTASASCPMRILYHPYHRTGCSGCVVVYSVDRRGQLVELCELACVARFPLSIGYEQILERGKRKLSNSKELYVGTTYFQKCCIPNVLQYVSAKRAC